MNLLKNKIFMVVLIDWIDTNFFVGPLCLVHWMILIETFFIAIYTPMIYFLKRRYPKKLNYLLNVHVFGFLISLYIYLYSFCWTNK